MYTSEPKKFETEGSPAEQTEFPKNSTYSGWVPHAQSKLSEKKFAFLASLNSVRAFR